MEASGVPEWDGEICRVCEQALSISGAGDDLPYDLRARVSARYAQALVYRGEYDRAGPVSRDALAAAEAAGDPATLVEALRARQLACCAPEGLAERIVLAGRMLEAASALGSAWAEMWGRMWRIDTLFETGQLRLIQRELTDLGACLDRLSGPVGRWQYLEMAATLALATGRFAEAARLANEGFKLFSDMGHPAAFGALAVILSQSGVHIGMDRSGLADLFDHIPAHLRPEAVDTTQGVATIFPALTLTLIRLHRGDPAGAEAALALAGPIRTWTPSPAMRMAAWGHALVVAIDLGRTEDIEFLASQLEPFRGQHAANGAGPGVYMGPVELYTGLAAAALGRLDAAVRDLEAAASLCDANGARGYAVQARVELAAALARGSLLSRPGPGAAALDAAGARPSNSAWFRSPSGSTSCGRGYRPPQPPRSLAEPPRGRGGQAGRARADQQADRRDPVRLRTHGREPRPVHPGQARLQPPQPDRRAGPRTLANEYSAEYFPGWPDPGLPVASFLPAHTSAHKGKAGQSWRISTSPSRRARPSRTSAQSPPSTTHPQDIDGLLAWAAGSDENGLNVVTVWESRAHQERWAAEQLFPVFPEFGLSGTPGQLRVHRVRGRRAVHPLNPELSGARSRRPRPDAGRLRLGHNGARARTIRPVPAATSRPR